MSSDGDRREVTVSVSWDPDAPATDGGGLHVPFCRSCWRRLDRRHDVLQGDVCVVCADHADPGRARGMYDVGDRDEFLHVCDACRIDLIRERQTAEVVGL